MASQPLVALPTDRKFIGAHPFLVVGEKYVRAVADGAGAIPLPWPSLIPPLPVRDLLDTVDGLLLTGAVSNIEPHHYGDEPSYEGNLHDPARDANTLPLAKRAAAAGVPVLAICRGFQEVNVAYGGSLYQKVHEQPGLLDHREDATAPLDAQYGPAHAIDIVPGGLLEKIAGGRSAQVNSVHGQGVRRLGDGLRVEATAPDGLVEAFSLPGDGFLLAVQWHPEWKVMENPFHLGIFRAFGDACRERAAKRKDHNLSVSP
jgi:putative glutamine amidotransferase